MSSLRHLSKRYGANIERLPHYTRKMFEQLSAKAQLPGFRSDAAPVDDRKKFRKPEDWKVEVGDRVMLVGGKFNGVITKVVGKQEDTNHIYVEEANMKKIVVPKYLWQQEQSTYSLNYPKSIHARSVKVVGTRVNEVTGEEETFAADDVVFKGTYYDKDYMKYMPLRRVRYNEDIIIPWPRPSPVDECEYSTSEKEVSERTYIPNSLVHSGMPTNIVQSLRDPIAKRPYKWDKKKFTQSEINRLTAPEMPVPEHRLAHRQERKEMREAQIKEMSPEVLEFIGSKVAAHLNNITDPNFAVFVEKNSPQYFIDKKAKKLQKKQENMQKAKDAEERNELLGKKKKYYGKKFE